MNTLQLRRLRTKEIIRANNIESQEHLLKLLGNEGFELTQATLSRELKKMNVSKILNPDNSYCYSIPTESKSGIKSAYKGFLSLDFSGSLAIIKTLAGYAGPLAVIIDNNPSDLISGTVAGRDTIFVALKGKIVDKEGFNNYLNMILSDKEE